MKNVFSKRDKSILIGLYLSKFDEEALRALGFKGFNEAFNTLGYSIGSKPASIKNYRDEFDPLFPNQRKGWHKRPIRDYCKIFFDGFSQLRFGSFTELIKSFVIENYDIDKIAAKVEKKDMSETVARRLVTGKAAEEYFKLNFKLVSKFIIYELKDTTNLACGFDYKLVFEEDFYCVEVKGLNSNSGGIALTEKEFHVANELRGKYCLFVVMNFIDKPSHQIFFDPLNSKLAFKKVERKVTQINYSATI